VCYKCSTSVHSVLQVNWVKFQALQKQTKDFLLYNQTTGVNLGYSKLCSALSTEYLQYNNLFIYLFILVQLLLQSPE